MTAWVDPVKDEPSGSHYKIFHSKLANTDWSYLVYLPPDYEASLQTRYPAIYWLHGGGGTQRQGSGAPHLGVRHSDQFGVVSGLAAALISEQDEPMKVPPVAFERVYGSDPAYFHENTVWTDTERNASKLRSGILIRIVVGDKDAWVYQRLQDYHALLNRLQIPHEFIVVPGAQHPAVPVYDWLGDRAFDIYNRAFGSLKQ
jgi:enterochelin esterase-like enzyme